MTTTRKIFVHSVAHAHGFGANLASITEQDARAGIPAWGKKFPGNDDDHDISECTLDDPAFGALHAAIVGALAFKADAFDSDEQVNGGDLVEWFSQWRETAKAARAGIPSDAPSPVLDANDLSRIADALNERATGLARDAAAPMTAPEMREAFEADRRTTLATLAKVQAAMAAGKEG